MLTPPTVSLLGLSYADMSPAALTRLLHEQLLRGERPMRIFTPNATIAAAAYRDPERHRLLSEAELLLPDGRGVLLAAGLSGKRLCHRLPGIEAGERLLALCAAERMPVYLLGAAPGIARRAALAWQRRLPTLPVAGTHHGYFSPSESPRIEQLIRDSGARVLLVCLGFPAQETWICEHLPYLPGIRIAMGLGGSFDVWAGEVRRAPALWRSVGAEWLWRSLRQPSRIRELVRTYPFFRAAARSKRDSAPVNI